MELQKRIATAVVLVPVLTYCIFFLSNDFFKLSMALVFALAAWEWCRLIGVDKLLLQAVYIAVGLLICFSTQWLPSVAVYALAASWWLGALFLVIGFPESDRFWKDNMPIKLAIGVLILVPTWLGLVELHAESPEKLIFVFVLIWAADIGAYFAGRQFGKRKLAPKVSPGKSIEGVLGGLLLSLGIGLAVKSQVGLESLGLLPAIILFTAVILFSVLGDLTESMFKRVSGVKDSSQLLPGHGGILDRIDSLTSAIPIYYAVYALVTI